jgi:hypothetical protein
MTCMIERIIYGLTHPPERDSELGIGRYAAWQTPIHREVVKKCFRSIHCGVKYEESEAETS